MTALAIELGVAEGHIDLDLSDLRSAVSTAVKELDRLERQGKLAQSQMDRLTAETKDTADAFEQAQQKSKALAFQIDTAKGKISTYQTGIQGLKKMIEQASKEQKNLTKKIEDTTKKYQDAEKKVEKLSDAYKQAKKQLEEVTKAQGEESQAAQEASEQLESAKKAYENAAKKADTYRNKLLQLESKHADLGQEIDGSKAKINEFSTEINQAQTKILGLANEMAKAQSKLLTFGDAAQTVGQKWQDAGEKINRVGTGLTLGLTTPIVAAGTYAVKSAMDFESAWTGVTKTVDGTQQQLDELRQGIIDMSMELPSSTTEISAVAEAAGQLGIETPNILEFARTMIDLGNSTNLSAEEAATALARFANVTGMSQTEFGRLGAVIVDLGNNFATTEAEIVEMASRLSGAGTQIGMTEPQIMSFATALSSVGIEAEAGGTAFSTLMSKMQLAVEKGGESLDQFAEVAGMSADEFQKAFREDAADAIMAFIEGLSDCEEQGVSAIKVLSDMDITEVRMRDALLRAAGASDVFSEALDVGSQAWEDNIALTNEASKRYETTESKLAMAKNQLSDAARTIGEHLLPVVAGLAGDIAELAKAFSELSPETQKTIIKLAAMAAAIGPVTKGIGLTTQGIGLVTENVGKLFKALGKNSAAKSAAKAVEGLAGAAASAGTQATAATTATKGFSSVLGKIGSKAGVAALATTAIIGIGAAFDYVWKEAAKSKSLEEHFGKIKLSAEEVEDVAQRLTTNEWTMRVDAAISAKETLEEFESDIISSVEEMNKIGWKVGVGLELTEEEKETFISSAQEFVSSAQEYLEQQHYTVSLAINAMMPPGESYKKLVGFTNDFYNATYKEMERLGQELSDAVNEAWADGIFTEDEYLNVLEIQNKIQALVDKVADAKYKGQLKAIELQAPKDGTLDAESFQNLQEELGKQMEERFASAEETYAMNLANIELMLDEGAISEEEYDKMIADLTREFNAQKGEIVLDSLTIQIDTIQANYEEEINKYTETFSQTFNSAIQKMLDGDFESPDWGGVWYELSESFVAGQKEFSNLISQQGNKEAIEALVKQMEPTTAQLEEIAEKYKAMGEVPPASIVEGLNDAYNLEALSGSTDHMFEIIAAQIMSSDDAKAAMEAAAIAGEQIDQGLIDALRENYGYVYDAAEGTFEQVQAPVQEKVEDIKALMANVGLQITDSLAQTLMTKGPDILNKTTELLGQLQTGAALKQEELSTVFSTLGYTSVDQLTAALSGKEPEVQSKTIELLAQLSGGVQANQDSLMNLFSSLGWNVAEGLISSMGSQEANVQMQAMGLLSQIQNADATKRAEILNQLRELGVISGSELANSLATQYDVVYDSSSNTFSATGQAAADAIENGNSEVQASTETTGETYKTTLDNADLPEYAEETGSETTQSMASGIESERENVRSATDDVRSVVQSGMNPSKVPSYSYGATIASNFASGLRSRKSEVQSAAQSLLSAAQSNMSAYTYSAPASARMASAPLNDTPGMEMERMQRATAVSLYPDIPTFYDSRITTEGFGEMIDMRDFQAPEVTKYEMQSGEEIDYGKLGKAIADELRKSPIVVESEVNNNLDITVGLDSETVGRKLTPVVSKIQAKNSKFHQ